MRTWDIQTDEQMKELVSRINEIAGSIEKLNRRIRKERKREDGQERKNSLYVLVLLYAGFYLQYENDRVQLKRLIRHRYSRLKRRRTALKAAENVSRQEVLSYCLECAGYDRLIRSIQAPAFDPALLRSAGRQCFDVS